MFVTINQDTNAEASWAAFGQTGPAPKLWIATITFKSGKSVTLAGDLKFPSGMFKRPAKVTGMWQGDVPPTEDEVKRVYHKLKLQGASSY